MEYAVIMAGGSGKRLWPLSRKNRPKQIIDIFDGQSLIQLCVKRIKDIFETDRILVVTNQEFTLYLNPGERVRMRYQTRGNITPTAASPFRQISAPRSWTRRSARTR